jgi:hypothetical protein
MRGWTHIEDRKRFRQANKISRFFSPDHFSLTKDHLLPFQEERLERGGMESNSIHTESKIGYVSHFEDYAEKKKIVKPAPVHPH